MNYFSAQIIIVASNGAGEDAFWTQILVLAVLAAVVGIGSLIKTRANRLKEHQQYYPEDIHRPYSWYHWRIKALKQMKDRYLGVFFKALQLKTVTEGRLFNFRRAGKARLEKQQSKPGREAEKELNSGMELLELDFLLSIIENTKGDDEKDVMMRKLSFNELLRRGQLCAASSNTLKVYAINDGNIYDKNIQCEAMKELAERTGPVSDYGFELKEISKDSGVKETSTVRCS